MRHHSPRVRPADNGRVHDPKIANPEGAETNLWLRPFYPPEDSPVEPLRFGCKGAGRKPGLPKECLRPPELYPMTARFGAAPFLCRLKPHSLLERFR